MTTLNLEVSDFHRNASACAEFDHLSLDVGQTADECVCVIYGICAPLYHHFAPRPIYVLHVIADLVQCARNVECRKQRKVLGIWCDQCVEHCTSLINMRRVFVGLPYWLATADLLNQIPGRFKAGICDLYQVPNSERSSRKLHIVTLIGFVLSPGDFGQRVFPMLFARKSESSVNSGDRADSLHPASRLLTPKQRAKCVNQQYHAKQREERDRCYQRRARPFVNSLNHPLNLLKGK